MPFQSEKQRRYLWANHPDIAQRWEQEYAGGGIARLHQAFPKNMTVGEEMISIGTPLENQMAELTDSQKKYIDYEKSNLERGFKTPEHVFETINNPALGKFEKNTLNPFKGAQEPTTKEEYNNYLKSLGIDAQLSSLTNDQYLDQNNLYADAGTFANDAMFSGIGADFPNFFTDAQANETLDLNDEELTTNINELSDIYSPSKDYGQFFRQQPVDEYVPWHQRGTLKDVFQAGDFPLRDNFAKTKATVSDLVEGGIDKTRAGGKWLKDLALTAGGAIADIPLGLLNLFQGQFQNTPEEDAMVDLYGGNTIRSGPMAGYNTASMYGRGIIDATQRRLDRRAQVKTDKWNQKKKERWDRANQALEKELARQKEAKEKAEREKQAAFQRQLDQAYQQHGGGGDSPSGGGGRYDGASSKQEWSRDPTSYSGSFAHGGLAGLWPKR